MRDFDPWEGLEYKRRNIGLKKAKGHNGDG
jgi:hypothetical protein